MDSLAKINICVIKYFVQFNTINKVWVITKTSPMVPINNKALNYNYQGVIGYIFKLNCSKSLPMQQHKYIFMWRQKCILN